MAIDARSIQVCLWKVVNFSMKMCYNFVKKYPAFSSLFISFFLLYMFLPSVFTFLIHSLLVFALIFVVYRVFLSAKYKRTENVKDYKKNDENPSIVKDDHKMGKNGVHSKATRRNAKEKDKEGKTRTSIEDKIMVCSTRFNDDMVDKNAVVEENPKDIREVKVDSVINSAEGPKKNSGGKGETERETSEDSEDEEDACEDRNKAVEWTADDQKNLMDLGNSEVERNKRLESLIARRKARKLFCIQVRNTLMSTGNNDSRDHTASILAPRNNPFLANSNPTSPVPGSAPSVLLPMHNPFDLPYDPYEEKPNLTGDSFHEEFLADHQKDMTFCRHESFSFGAFFSAENRLDQSGTFFQDFPFKQRAPKKLENSEIGSHLDKKDVDKVMKKESSQENETIFNDGSAEDHANKEGQAFERVFDLADIRHEQENINDGSSSSSTSEENIPIPKPNKDAILRSLTSFARKNTALAKNDNGEENGVSYDSDQFMFDRTRPVDHFYYADKEMHHTRANSLASDMQVEVSEISSPRSISSPDEESSEDIKKEINSGGEETWVDSSHGSGIDEYESNSKVHDVSEQDVTEFGFSTIKREADPSTSDMLPEKVEKDSISKYSLSPSTSELTETSQSHVVDSNPEHSGDLDSLDTFSSQNLDILELGKAQHSTEEVVAHTSPINSEIPVESSNSPEKVDRDIETNNDVSDLETPMNNVMKKLNMTNNTDNEAQNGAIEHGVSEVELPGAFIDPTASVVVSEFATEPVPSSSSSCSSPKSVLQPEFSTDLISSLDLNQGISMEVQQSDNSQMVENNLIHELPPESLNHSATQNTLYRTEDSADQLSRDLETFKSPRFIDTLYCVPFCPTNEEQLPASFSRFFQELQDQSVHQKTPCEEAVVIENEARINSEFVKDNEGKNQLSIKQEAVVELLEPSSSSGSKVTEDAKENPREIDGDEGVIDPSKAIEGNEKSEVIKIQESPDASENEVEDQPKAMDANDNSEAIKAVEGESKTWMPHEAPFDPNQTELKDSSNHASYKEIKEPLDPPLRSIEEDVINFNQNEPVIIESGGKELKAIIADNVEASESVGPSETAVVDLLESSNSYGSKYIEDVDKHPSEINGDERAGGPAKATQMNENSGPEVKTQESASVNEVADQPLTTDSNDNSEAIKTVEGESGTWTLLKAAFDTNQKELKGDTSNPVSYKEIREPLDPPLGRSTEEDNIIFNQNESVINESVDKELKAIIGDDVEASKSVEPTEGVGPSKAAEGNEKSSPEIKTPESQEADQPKGADANDNSEAMQAVEGESKTRTPREAAFDSSQTELKGNISNPVSCMENKEPLDPPLEEDDIIFKQNVPIISESGDKELKAITQVNAEASGRFETSEGVVGPSKVAEGNENSVPEVKTQESVEENANEVADQPKGADANDNSEAIKAVDGESRTRMPHEAAFNQNQTELKDDSSNPVGYKELKETLNPPLRSIQEGDIIFNLNEPLISESGDKELKGIIRDNVEASESVEPSESVVTSASRSVEGGHKNVNEVETTVVASRVVEEDQSLNDNKA